MNQIISLLTEYWVVVVLLLSLLLLFLNLREALKDILLFYRVMSGRGREEIRNFLLRLVNLPEETIRELLTNRVIPDRSTGLVEEVVLSHTQYLGDKVAVGVHDTPSGKVQTEYYVDLVTACCDTKTRAKLANMLAIKILGTLKLKQYTYEAIAVSAMGNQLLAAEVSNILDKPMVVFGDIAGVAFPQRFQRAPHYKRYIVVDGLSATGEEILHLGRAIKETGAEVKYIFVILDRCFGAKDRVRRESPFPYALELIYLEEFDDRRCQLEGQ